MTRRTIAKFTNTFIFTITFFVPITNILHRQRLSLIPRVWAMQWISATITDLKKSNRCFIIYGMRRIRWSFRKEQKIAEGRAKQVSIWALSFLSHCETKRARSSEG